MTVRKQIEHILRVADGNEQRYTVTSQQLLWVFNRERKLLGHPYCDSYPIFSVELADVEARWESTESDALADESIREDAAARLKAARKFVPEDWHYVAELMCDYLYNGDTYYDALEYALDRVAGLNQEEAA